MFWALSGEKGKGYKNEEKTNFDNGSVIVVCVDGWV